MHVNIIKILLKNNKKTGHTTLSFLSHLLFLVSVFFLACNTNENDINKIVPYTGPLMEADNIETLYTDSAKIKVRLTAPKQQQMETGDLHFPQGVYIEFYNEKEIKSSTLKANSGIYSKEKDLYTVTGNVIIIDSLKSQKMNTEELNWVPAKQKIFTDKFVTIQTKEEVLKGQGLEAKQDFSSYRILKPTGTFPITQE
jgi:LPS export ABC transporter protein LptC